MEATKVGADEKKRDSEEQSVKMEKQRTVRNSS
jgi:hypothetical protein